MTENASPAAAPAAAPAAPSTSPAPATPAAAPAPAASPPAAPAAAPSAAAPAPAATLRPAWLPETHWNAQLNAINFDALQKDFESKAALTSRKPEDIKLLTKLPDDFTLPEGTAWKMNEKDPYVGGLRDLAIKHGITQEVANDFMLMDARIKRDSYLADNAAAKAFEEAENKKLGDSHQARKDSILNWLNASGLEPDERLAVATGRVGTAAFVTGLEKIIQKVVGGIAANAGGQPAPTEPSKPPLSWQRRMYPNMPSIEDRKAS